MQLVPKLCAFQYSQNFTKQGAVLRTIGARVTTKVFERKRQFKRNYV